MCVLWNDFFVFFFVFFGVCKNLKKICLLCILRTTMQHIHFMLRIFTKIARCAMYVHGNGNKQLKWLKKMNCMQTWKSSLYKWNKFKWNLAEDRVRIIQSKDVFFFFFLVKSEIETIFSSCLQDVLFNSILLYFSIFYIKFFQKPHNIYTIILCKEITLMKMLDGRLILLILSELKTQMNWGEMLKTKTHWLETCLFQQIWYKLFINTSEC